MPIKSLNLSLSSMCPASCVFCPSERGTRDQGFMSIDLVKKLMKEVSSKNCPWKISTVQVGENGEALANPNFIRILQCIRSYLPLVKINLTTNMYWMRAEHTTDIFRYKLLDGLQLNIDGHDAQSYEAQKGISYDRVMGNFRDFMEIRAIVNPEFPVSITVMTLAEYCKKVWQLFHVLPAKIPSSFAVSTYEQTLQSLRSLRWITEDVPIRKSPVFFWAERKQDIAFEDLTDYQCPQLPRVENEAFISPSGLWYPCCFDSNQDQAFGNVAKETAANVYLSQKRQGFLAKLRERKYEEIGYPCNRVPFCRTVK